LSAILGQGPALAILFPATTALTGLISLPVISAQSMKRRQRFLSNRRLFGSPRGVVIGNHEHLAFKEAQCLLTGH
jgi:hypothetical protein